VTIVEPGGMRTDWAGSSMRTEESQSDYQQPHEFFSFWRALEEVGGSRDLVLRDNE
jgi:hypothetical protein